MTVTHSNCIICGNHFEVEHTGPVEIRQVVPPDQLSDAARFVLLKIPQIIRRGKPILLKDVAELTGYSISHTRRIMLELSGAGYVTTRPKGKRQHAYLVG